MLATSSALKNSNSTFHSIVSLQAVIFLGALLMLFGLWNADPYSENLITPLCLIFTLHFAWVLWSWNVMTGRWFDSYALIFVSLCFFSGGHFLLEVLNLNEDGVLLGAFSAGTTNRTILLVIASAAAYHLGGVLLCLREASYTRLCNETEFNRSAVSFSPGRAKLIGVFFLLVSIPSTIYIMVNSVEMAATTGYFSRYQQEILIGINNWQSVLSTFFVPGILITFAMYHNSRRSVEICWILMFAYAVANMFVGSRGAALLAFVPMVLLHHNLVGRIRAIYLISGSLAMLVLLPLIAMTRNVTTESRYDIITSALSANLIQSSIKEMGGSAGTIANTIELVPASRKYDYGIGYGYAMLTAIPNFFWERHLSAQWGSYTTWLVWTVDPYTARLNGSYGFSVIAEAYANFSILGPPAILGILGFTIAMIGSRTRNSRQPFAAALEAVFLSLMLIMPRAEFFDLFRPIIWFCLIPYLLVKR